MKTDAFDNLGYLLKRSQYAALAALEREAGLSNADLARRCFVTPQTMHQILLGLERSKLLERTNHPEHGRVQTTALTVKGHTLLIQAHKRVLSVETKMLKGFTTRERNETKQKLIRLSENLESET